MTTSKSRPQSDEFTNCLDAAPASRSTRREPEPLRRAQADRATRSDIDLSPVLPGINLESPCVNIDKRNNILHADELLRRSKAGSSSVSILKGGVAFTLEVRATGQVASETSTQREGRSRQGDRHHRHPRQRFRRRRADRPPGRRQPHRGPARRASRTKDNPDVVDTVKKPARLDFRLVHPHPDTRWCPGEIPPPGLRGDDRSSRSGAERSVGATSSSSASRR